MSVPRPSTILSTLLLALFVLATSGACAKSTDRGDGTVMRANATLLERGVSDQAVVRQGSLTFPRRGNEQLLAHARGDILVGHRQSAPGGHNPYGFLRRIVSIGTEGDLIVIETSPATLEEAFAQATFQSTKEPLSAKTAAYGGAPPARIAGGDAGTGEGSGGKNDGSFRLNSSISATVGLSAGIAGELTFDPRIDAGAQIDLGGVREFHAILEGDFHARLIAKLVASAALSADQSVKLFEFSKPIVIEALEITYVGQIWVRCHEELDAALSVEGGASLDVTRIALGIRYDHGEFHPVNTYDTSFRTFGPTLTGTAAVGMKCGVGYVSKFMIYDTIGPTFELRPFARIVRTFPGCDVTAFAGLDGAIGASIQVPIVHTPVKDWAFPFTIAEVPIYTGAAGDCGGQPSAGAGGDFGDETLWPLATTSTHPAHAVADDANVYFTTNGTLPRCGDGAVMSVPKTGGTTVTIAAAQDDPIGIAIDATHVYWVDHGPCGSPGFAGRVMKARKDGSGAPETLVASANQPVAIALDDAYVYYTIGATTVRGAVMRVAKTGGAPTTLLDGLDLPFGLAVDDDGVFVATHGGDSDPGEGLDISDDGLVLRVAKTGGAATTIAEEQASPYGLVTDADHVYWVDAGDESGGLVLSARKSGGAVTVLARGQDYPYGIAVDGTNVFWTTANAIAYVPKTGGDAAELLFSPHAPVALALDPSRDAKGRTAAIFWTARPSETVGGVDLGDGAVFGAQLVWP